MARKVERTKNGVSRKKNQKAVTQSRKDAKNIYFLNQRSRFVRLSLRLGVFA